MLASNELRDLIWFGLDGLSDCFINLSELEGSDAIGSDQLYRQCNDTLKIVVKLIDKFDWGVESAMTAERNRSDRQSLSSARSKWAIRMSSSWFASSNDFFVEIDCLLRCEGLLNAIDSVEEQSLLKS
jgi:hypothetical protein